MLARERKGSWNHITVFNQVEWESFSLVSSTLVPPSLCLSRCVFSEAVRIHRFFHLNTVGFLLLFSFLVAMGSVFLIQSMKFIVYFAYDGNEMYCCNVVFSLK